MWAPFFLLETLSKRIYGKCHHQCLGHAVIQRRPKQRSDGHGGGETGKMEGNYSVYTKEEAVY